MFGPGKVLSLEWDYELLQLSNHNDKNIIHSSVLIITLFLSSHFDDKKARYF